MALQSGSCRRIAIFCAFLGVAAVTLEAQARMIVYPSRGQSAQQQARDETECRSFAQRETGFDPANWGPTAPVSVPASDVARGAAVGAAFGALGGSVGGRAGRGAAAGAGAGAAAGLLGLGRGASNARDAQRRNTADFQSQRAAFDRAFAICMRGRGYTVG